MKHIQTFLAVIIFLICAPAFAADTDNANDPFQDIVTNYRAANPKPRLPEDAYKFKVQAEFAVQEKQFDKAVELYGKALEIAPWWPEGHFNRALILGETKKYDEAMSEMKRYLLLVPDAPDARAAQNKIYQWESVAGPELPQGYVSQGGLTWMPINSSTKNWSDANAYCTNTAINGQTGWRLPTKDELSALYNSGATKGQGWTLSTPWSSTPGSAGGYYFVDLHNGFVDSYYFANSHYVTCVR
jgi:tetratricopeptide (TPR) repeat protein